VNCNTDYSSRSAAPASEEPATVEDSSPVEETPAAEPEKEIEASKEE
jgi:hypothetical protein